MNRLDQDTLAAALQRAIGARNELLRQLQAEGTDCYRLLHGIAEGAPGITLDRYGSLLLLQTFREPLPANKVLELQSLTNAALGLELPIVCNHRGTRRGATMPDEHAPHQPPAHEPTAAGLAEHACHEGGVRLPIRARHRGQDPWLFLDLRAGRRRVQKIAAGRSVLNLFAYTCGVGVMAATAGAAKVLNVDFAQSALDVGRSAADALQLPPERFQTLHSDCLPILRQLAGMPVQRRGKHLPYVRVPREAFDLIVLDPPRYAKSRFGDIDVVRDYQSLWKPCLQILPPGGQALVTNHVPQVAASDWHEMLRRCAAKAGRPVRELEPIPVDADFPSFDGQAPLKMALVTC